MPKPRASNASVCKSTFAVYSPILTHTAGFVLSTWKGTNERSDRDRRPDWSDTVAHQAFNYKCPIFHNLRILVSAILGRTIRELGGGCLTVDLPSMALQPKDFAAMLNGEWRLSNKKRRGKQ